MASIEEEARFCQSPNYGQIFFEHRRQVQLLLLGTIYSLRLLSSQPNLETFPFHPPHLSRRTKPIPLDVVLQVEDTLASALVGTETSI